MIFFFFFSPNDFLNHCFVMFVYSLLCSVNDVLLAFAGETKLFSYLLLAVNGAA